MICIHCRLEIIPEPELLNDDIKRFVDKQWGEWHCSTPTSLPGISSVSEILHSPAHEISGQLLDDLVEYLIGAAETYDRFGEPGAELFAQLAEEVAQKTKLVES